MAAIGVALAVLGALAGVWLLNSTGDRAEVLVVVRDVPYGQVITAADVTATAASLDPSVAVVAAADSDTVVGRVAATDLVAGSLLSPGQVTDSVPPAAGQVLVAMALPADRMPAGGLRAGDRVQVVDTPTADADPTTATSASIPATVVRLGDPDVNGVTVVDVTAAQTDGAALAARSATGRFAFVLLPAGH